MDTDDDKDLKPPLSNVTNSAINTAQGTTGSTPVKVKDEIKEEPMDVEPSSKSQFEPRKCPEKQIISPKNHAATSPDDFPTKGFASTHLENAQMATAR